MGRGTNEQDERQLQRRAPARTLQLQSLHPDDRTLMYLHGLLAEIGDLDPEWTLLGRIIGDLEQRRTVEIGIDELSTLISLIDWFEDEESDPYEIVFELKMEVLYGQPLLPDGFDQCYALRADERRQLLETEIPLGEEEIAEGGVHEVVLADGSLVVVKFFNPHDHDQEADLLRNRLAPARAAAAELLAFRIADRLGEPYRSIATPVVVREIHGRDALVSVHRRGEHVREIPADLSPALREQLEAAALFDAVIGEPDRHSLNWLLDREADTIAAFDHGNALHDYDGETRPGAFLDWRLQTWPRLNRLELTTLLDLSSSTLIGEVERLLGQKAAAKLRGRIEGMLTSRRLVDGRNS